MCEISLSAIKNVCLVFHIMSATYFPYFQNMTNESFSSVKRKSLSLKKSVFADTTSWRDFIMVAIERLHALRVHSLNGNSVDESNIYILMRDKYAMLPIKCSPY